MANSVDSNRKKTISTLYPARFIRRSRSTYVRPLKVDSKANDPWVLISRSSSDKSNRPAALAASSGCKGESPLAIRSALTKCLIPWASVRNWRANVVFPAPFGPAMMRHRGFGFFTLTRSPSSPLSPGASPSLRRSAPCRRSRTLRTVRSACRARSSGRGCRGASLGRCTRGRP